LANAAKTGKSWRKPFPSFGVVDRMSLCVAGVCPEGAALVAERTDVKPSATFTVSRF
jgi:hypothetical protein